VDGSGNVYYTFTPRQGGDRTKSDDGFYR
jgi:hypothetical protein